MKPEKILLPIDVASCPLEVFHLVNGLAARPEVTVILLHVVTPNAATTKNHSGDGPDREALRHLRRLADTHVHPIASTATHVRVGNPAEEILAEARAERADLIVLPTHSRSFWDRLKALWKRASNNGVSALAERVIREAECAVFVGPVKTRFNCQKAWGRPVTPNSAEPAEAETGHFSGGRTQTEPSPAGVFAEASRAP
jgi:nucleotide-binding universal stress UspA family protein